jgi:hypothetical protein
MIVGLFKGSDQLLQVILDFEIVGAEHRSKRAAVGREHRAQFEKGNPGVQNTNENDNMD